MKSKFVRFTLKNLFTIITIVITLLFMLNIFMAIQSSHEVKYNAVIKEKTVEVYRNSIKQFIVIENKDTGELETEITSSDVYDTLNVGDTFVKVNIVGRSVGLAFACLLLYGMVLLMFGSTIETFYLRKLHEKYREYL